MRMTNKLAVLFILVVTIIGCAKRSDTDTQAINEACTLEMEAARTAVLLRNKGKSKADLVQTLPPVAESSTRLLQQLHAIVEEVYTFPELNEVIYATYRFQYCVRQLQHRFVPHNLQPIYNELLACQQQYGNQASKESTVCVLNSFPQGADIPAPAKHDSAL